MLPFPSPAQASRVESAAKCHMFMQSLVHITNEEVQLCVHKNIQGFYLKKAVEKQEWKWNRADSA